MTSKRTAVITLAFSAVFASALLTGCSTTEAKDEAVVAEAPAPSESAPEPETEPEIAEAETAVSQCELDFQEAAAVPLSETNDDILAKTLRSCTSVPEWKSMLKNYPLVLGVSSVTQQEVDLSFELMCSNFGSGSTLC